MPTCTECNDYFGSIVEADKHHCPAEKNSSVPVRHDADGMYLVKEVGECRFDVVQKSSGVIVASAARKDTAGQAANAINACAVVPKMSPAQDDPRLSVVDHETLIARLETCAEQSEQGMNFAGTPHACRDAAERIRQLEECLRHTRRLVGIAAVNGFVGEQSITNLYTNNGKISRLVPIRPEDLFDYDSMLEEPLKSQSL